MNKRVVLVRPQVERPDYSKLREPVGNLSGTSPSLKGGEEGPDPQEKNSVAPVVEEALALAERFTVEQRQQLLDQLALRNQAASAHRDDRDLDMWSHAVCDALGSVMGSQEGLGYGPLVIRKHLGSSAAWRPVKDFMEASRLKSLTVTERQGVYVLLARLLVDHARFVARRSGAPLGAKLVAACAGNLAGVFDDQFPGYVAAGLAPMVARQLSARQPAVAEL